MTEVPAGGYANPAIAGSGAIALGLAASASVLGGVTVLARSDTSAWRAEEEIEKLCTRVEGGDASQVRVTTSPADVEGADLIVEAIVEEVDTKAAMLASLGEICPQADLATTTSSLGIAELGERAGIPERFYGLHVFNPVTRMELIELCLPAALGAGVGDRAAGLLRGARQAHRRGARRGRLRRQPAALSLSVRRRAAARRAGAGAARGRTDRERAAG